MAADSAVVFQNLGKRFRLAGEYHAIIHAGGHSLIIQNIVGEIG